MTNAWKIARKGKENFGGKVKEYFSQALRMAWAIFKKGEKTMSGVNGTIKDFDLPELEGTGKQVAWANKIRQEAAGTLQDEVTHEEWKEGQPKRSVAQLVEALQNEEATQEYLDELPEFLVDRTIKSMNELLERYERMIEIATNPSAKFWIDNRGNQEKNYMFNKFAEYVQTGVKEF